MIHVARRADDKSGTFLLVHLVVNPPMTAPGGARSDFRRRLVISDLEHAKLAAHRAHAFVVRFSCLSIVTRHCRIKTLRKLGFPLAVFSQCREGIVSLARSGHSLGDIARVSSNAGSYHAEADVFFVG